MIVARGIPVDDGEGVVALSEGGLNVVITKKYEWWIPTQATTKSYNDTTLLPLTIEKIINIGSGAVDSVTVT
jgi:hypothetical protein